MIKLMKRNCFNRGIVFAFLGEVSKMKGHGYYQDIETGKPYIYDMENMEELTQEEL